MEEDWLYNVHNSTLFGVPMLQRWIDLLVWERFLNEHSHIKTIIELGTYTGVFSTFLLLQATRRSMNFYTFDNQHREELNNPTAQLINLQSHFCLGDIFDETTETVIKAMSNHPILLYCDNGYKYKEVITFFPYLQPGDYLVVHDWGTEFTELNIEPFEDKVEPVFWDECEEMKSLTRFWLRKPEK